MTSQILALREHLIAARVTCAVMEATGAYWKPFVRHETPGIEWGERHAPLVSRSWLVKLGGSLIWGTPGKAGAASDKVRDGLALSDSPGPPSSDEKAYVRNRCLTLRKSSAGSNRLFSMNLGVGRVRRHN